MRFYRASIIRNQGKVTNNDNKCKCMTTNDVISTINIYNNCIYTIHGDRSIAHTAEMLIVQQICVKYKPNCGICGKSTKIGVYDV